MIYWLLVIILAYLFLGAASLCDKLVLSGKPKPSSYTFYTGVFSLVALVLIPFAKFNFPSAIGLTWIVLDAIVHVVGLYTMYVALKKFDVSRVIATIGATQPIFIFILAWFFGGPQKMPPADILAFIILLLGTIIISIGKNIKITGDYLKITIFSSLMFSLDYIFLKFVFLNQTFIPGIIWIGIFIFLVVSTLLLRKDSRKEIFSKEMILNKKTQIAFFLAQTFGGVANFMQSFAISLAPIAFLAILDSLRGIQYAFLFLLTLLFSVFLPKLIKEELSRKIIFQKVISIALIAVGLAILVVY